MKRSCDLLLDDDVGDLEDIVVPLWRGLKDEKEFKKLLCRETTSRCGKERKAVKEREDLEFNRQEKTLLDTERMMENMKDQGMPMVMHCVEINFTESFRSRASPRHRAGVIQRTRRKILIPHRSCSRART